MTDATREFAAFLREYSTCVDQLWDAYVELGPGEVDRALFDPIQEKAARLSRLRDNVKWLDMVEWTTCEVSLDQATDMARRCATLPQGLCFVFGEAGLVPRRDQLNTFESTRETIRNLAVELGKRSQ